MRARLRRALQVDDAAIPRDCFIRLKLIRNDTPANVNLLELFTIMNRKSFSECICENLRPNNIWN